MGTSWDSLLDVIQVFGGLYIAYVGIDMKKSGVLTQYSLIGKNVVLSKAPDIPGFIRTMYLKYIICGTVLFIAGLISLYLNRNSMMSDTVYFGLLAILIADLAAFSFFLLRAQKRYLLS